MSSEVGRRSDACIACDTPFPANHELASVPNAARVAFDPVHGRVWRICTSCGEWNLLGPYAAAAALPEIEARFAAAAGQSVEADLLPIALSRTVDLLRVGATGASATDIAALKRRRELRALVALAIVFPVGMAAIYAGQVFFMYRHHATMFGIAELLTTASIYPLGRAVGRWRHNIPFSAPRTVAAGVATLMGFGLAILIHKWDIVVGASVVGSLFMVAALLWRPSSVLTVELSYPTEIRFYSPEQMALLSMSWLPDSEYLYVCDLPDGRELGGVDAAALLRKVLAFRFGSVVRIAPSMVDDAHRLLRTAGGLRGLLHALDGFRRDRDGRVLLAELPRIYQAALDLALAPPAGNAASDVALRERAREATTIAEHAESLDRET